MGEGGYPHVRKLPQCAVDNELARHPIKGVLLDARQCVAGVARQLHIARVPVERIPWNAGRFRSVACV